LAHFSGFEKESAYKYLKAIWLIRNFMLNQ
jgi:hypothetical protein